MSSFLGEIELSFAHAYLGFEYGINGLFLRIISATVINLAFLCAYDCEAVKVMQA